MATLFDATTGAPAQVSDDQVVPALQSGKYAVPKGTTFPVALSDGSIVHEPVENLQNMLDAGATFVGPDAYEKQQAEAKFGGFVPGLEAAGEGLVGGATVGLSAPVEKAAGVDPADMKARALAHPYLHGAGELVGSILPSVVAPEAEATEAPGVWAAVKQGIAAIGAPSRAVGAVGEAAGGALGAAAGSKLLGGAANAATQSMLYQVGNNLEDTVFNNQDLTASHLLSGLPQAGIEGALFGAGVEGALGLTGKYVPEAMDKAAGWLDRLAAKNETADPVKDIRDFAGNFARADEHQKVVLKDVYGNAKPEIIDNLIGSKTVANAPVEALRDAVVKVGEADFATPFGKRAQDIFQRAIGDMGEAESLGDQFNILDKAKKDFDALRPISNRDGAADFALNDKLDSARSILKTTLEDQKVFGPGAASFQRDFNAVMGPYLNARAGVKAKFFEKPFKGEALEASPGKVGGYVNAEVGAKPYQADIRRQILDDYIASAKNLNAYLKQNVYENVGRQPVTADKVAGHVVDINELGANADKLAAARAQAMKSAQGATPSGALHMAELAAHVVLPYHAARGVRLGLGVLQGAKSEVVAGLAKRAATAARATGDAIRDFAHGKAAPAQEAITERVLVTPKARGETNATRVERLRKDNADMMGNPDALAARLGKNAPMMGRYAPRLSAAMAATIGRAVAYMHQAGQQASLPQTPLANPRNYPPSDDEAARYLRIHDACYDPPSTVRDMFRGTLTAEQVQAVKTVNPEWYAKCGQLLLKELSAGKEPPTFARLQSASTFLGMPLSPAQMNPAAFQAMYNQKQEQQATSNALKPPKMHAAGAGSMKFSERSSTGRQRTP